MRRGTLWLISLSLLVLSQGAAAGDEDPLFAAMEAELERSMEELVLPDAPEPYFVAYTVYDTWQAYAEGSFGSLMRSATGHIRPTRVEVRVGDYQRDNTNFNSFGDDPSGLGGASLVVDDDQVAIARDLWIVTDGAYKSAVEGMSRKHAGQEGSSGSDDRPADFARADPLQLLGDRGTPDLDLPGLEALARDLSALMKDHPEVEHSRVFASSAAWTRYLVNSEGTRVVDDGQLTVLRVVAAARAEDGLEVKDNCSWLTRDPSDLPDAAELERDVVAMLDRLRATAGAAPVEDYLGPVLFEGQAAAEIFRQLLVPQLMGTPAEESGNDWGMGDDRTLARVGRRVLPLGFSVVDDPTAASGGAPGAYQIDTEGVPAQRVQLVEDGVVHSLLMSRVPREDIEGSNGHGRGSTSSRIVGMPGVLTVEPQRPLRDKKLMRQAFKMARQAGRDHILVVRELDDPAMVAGTPVRRIRFGDDDGPALTEPLVMVRLYADGREEVVRSARFLVADHRVLRDIMAATASQSRYDYLAPAELYGGTNWVSGPTSGIAVSLHAPDAVLVAEMELGIRSDRAGPPALLDSPLAAD